MQEKRAALRERAAFSGVTLIFYLAHAATAFVASYLKEQGFAATQVGTIMAVLNCVGIVSSPILGNLADRMNSSRRAFIAAVAAAGVLMAFVPAVTGVMAVSVLLAAWAFFRIPANTLLDAWTLRSAQMRGSFSFGSIRLIGSISGATMCIIYGQMIRASGTNASALRGYCVFAALTVTLCLLQGRVYDDGTGKPRARQQRDRTGVRAALASRPFVVFLLCHAAMGIPIYCLTTFLPYKLSEIGASADVLGTLVAVKSYTEVPMLLCGATLMRRFDARRILTLCFFFFVLEHLVCAFAASAWVLGAALMFHGLVFGLYLAAMAQYVYRVTPPQAIASAQSLAGSAALLAAVVGSLAAGPLVQKFGSIGFFLCGAGLFALAGTAFAAFGAGTCTTDTM